MQNNCEVKDKTTEKISGPEKNELPKVGDVTVTEETEAISGVKCPVAVSQVNRMKMTATNNKKFPTIKKSRYRI